MPSPPALSTMFPEIVQLALSVFQLGMLNRRSIPFPPGPPSVVVTSVTLFPVIDAFEVSGVVPNESPYRYQTKYIPSAACEIVLFEIVGENTAVAIVDALSVTYM